MAFFRWGHPWSPLGDLEREVDRFLRGMNLSIHGIRPGRQFPAINIYELEHEFLLTAEIPGTEPSELDLTVDAGLLTIKGVRNDVKEVPDDKFRRQERFRGTWQRNVSLPDRIIEEELHAEFTNGVLVIHLPKAKQPEPRRIQIVDQQGANGGPAGSPKPQSSGRHIEVHNEEDNSAKQHNTDEK